MLGKRVERHEGDATVVAHQPLRLRVIVDKAPEVAPSPFVMKKVTLPSIFVRRKLCHLTDEDGRATGSTASALQASDEALLEEQTTAEEAVEATSMSLGFERLEEEEDVDGDSGDGMLFSSPPPTIQPVRPSVTFSYGGADSDSELISLGSHSPREPRSLIVEGASDDDEDDSEAEDAGNHDPQSDEGRGTEEDGSESDDEDEDEDDDQESHDAALDAGADEPEDEDEGEEEEERDDSGVVGAAAVSEGIGATHPSDAVNDEDEECDDDSAQEDGAAVDVDEDNDPNLLREHELSAGEQDIDVESQCADRSEDDRQNGQSGNDCQPEQGHGGFLLQLAEELATEEMAKAVHEKQSKPDSPTSSSFTTVPHQPDDASCGHPAQAATETYHEPSHAVKHAVHLVDTSVGSDGLSTNGVEAAVDRLCGRGDELLAEDKVKLEDVPEDSVRSDMIDRLRQIVARSKRATRNRRTKTKRVRGKSGSNLSRTAKIRPNGSGKAVDADTLLKAAAYASTTELPNGAVDDQVDRVSPQDALKGDVSVLTAYYDGSGMYASASGEDEDAIDVALAQATQSSLAKKRKFHDAMQDLALGDPQEPSAKRTVRAHSGNRMTWRLALSHTVSVAVGAVAAVVALSMLPDEE